MPVAPERMPHPKRRMRRLSLLRAVLSPSPSPAESSPIADRLACPDSIRIVLRRFAPVEHSVVANDSHASKTHFRFWLERSFKSLRGGLVAPGKHQNNVAWRKDSVEHGPRCEALHIVLE